MPIETTLKRWAFTALFFVIASLAFSNSLFEISSGIFMGLALLSFLTAREKPDFNWPWIACLGVYFLANILSVTQTPHWDAATRGVFRILRLILLCLSVIYVIDSETRVKKIFSFFLWVALAIGVDALIQGATGRELIRNRPFTAYQGDVQRLTGPFHHANDLSAYLCFVIFLFAGVLDQGIKFFSLKKYVLCWAGFAAALASLVGTYSRGAWLAAAAAAAAFAFYKKSWKFIAGLAVIALLLFLFSPAPVRQRAVSLLDRESGTVIERKILWAEAAGMIRQSPLFGLGVNTYARNEPLFKPRDSRTDYQYAHNGYLQMAAETGLLGLGSFLAVIFYFLYSTLPVFFRSSNLFLKGAGGGLVFGVIAFLLHSAADTNLQSLRLVSMLWLAMGAAWAARNCA